MSSLLVIDSSQTRSMVGITISGNVETLTGDASRQSAQELLPLIQQLLTATNTQLSELDAIGVVIGPGSFTGLRIGIGVAQGLGASLELPLVGLSSLALLAFSASREHQPRHWLVAERARDPEMYFAAYHIDQVQGARLISEEQVCGPESVALSPRQGLESFTPDLIWAGVGSAWQNPALLDRFAGQMEPDIYPTPASSIEAACILASMHYARGEVSRELLLPNYVKEELDYS